MKVYLDTSIILYAFDKKLNLKEMIIDFLEGMPEIVVTDSVIMEINKISKHKELLTSLVKKLYAIEKSPKGKVDDALLELSKGNILATQDLELKQKALKENIRVITVRQGKYLADG